MTTEKYRLTAEQVGGMVQTPEDKWCAIWDQIFEKYKPISSDFILEAMGLVVKNGISEGMTFEEIADKIQEEITRGTV